VKNGCKYYTKEAYREYIQQEIERSGGRAVPGHLLLLASEDSIKTNADNGDGAVMALPLQLVQRNLVPAWCEREQAVFLGTTRDLTGSFLATIGEAGNCEGLLRPRPHSLTQARDSLNEFGNAYRLGHIFLSYRLSASKVWVIIPN